MICEFSEPVNYLGESAGEGEPFFMKKLECAERFELIENSTTGAEFYIDKTMSYGDLILIVFISIILVFLIFKFVWNFICPRDKKL